MGSPVFSWFVKVVCLLILLNRALSFNSIYARVSMERSEDLYLRHHFCNKVDHKEIGRHTAICLDAEHRLSLSVLYHTVFRLVDETLTQDLKVEYLKNGAIVSLVVLSLGALHSRFFREASQALPMFAKQKDKLL